MNIKQLKTIVDNTTNSGVTFASILQVTEPKMTKGGRAGKPVNPYFGRVTKKTKAVIMLGNNYGSAIENRSKKLTGETIEFDSEPMKGRHWLDGYTNLIAENDNSEQLYLRTYHNLSKGKPSVTYLIDGQEANESQVSEMKEWLPKSYSSKKQEEAGLCEEEQIVPRDVKLENVKELKIGDYHFSE